MDTYSLLLMIHHWYLINRWILWHTGNKAKKTSGSLSHCRRVNLTAAIWPSWTLRCSSVCWVEKSALLSPSGEEVPPAAPWRGSHHQAADGPLVLAAARAGATAWSHLQIWGWQTWRMQPTGLQQSYHSLRQFRQIMIEEDEQKIELHVAKAMFFFSFGFQIVSRSWLSVLSFWLFFGNFILFYLFWLFKDNYTIGLLCFGSICNWVGKYELI